MSASRERKKRQELAAEGKSPKQLRRAAEAKAKKKRTIISIICIALVLAIGLGCLYGYVIRPNTAPRRAVALRTGDHELSAVDFGYYYYDSINSFYQNYGSYLSYFMSDASQPIDQQVYNEDTGETWADYFLQSAAESAKYDYAVYDAAKAAGYKLSAEGEQEIQDGMKTLEESVKNNGFKSLNDYFKQVYGKGCSKDSYIAYQRIRETAEEYAKKVDAERTYTDEEIQAKDDENPGQYSLVTYRAYYLSTNNYLPEDEETDEESEEELDEEAQAAAEEAEAAAKAEAFETLKADAEKMVAASKGNEDKYVDMALELATEGAKSTYENRDATLNSNVSYDNSNSLFVDWLFDESRKEGDVTSVEDSDNGVYVLYFLSLDRNEYNTVNVRHILIAPEQDEDSDEDGTNDTASEASDAAAKAKAEQILADWKAGAATEESFAALADENSADSPEGGLYEGVYHNQMVQEFNDWCFDPARKPGDTDIVKTTYGYHIMYFVGEGDTYRRVQIIDDLKSSDYDDWTDELTSERVAALDEAGTKYLRTDLVLGSST